MIDLLQSDPSSILDIGCGSGDNARLIRNRFKSCTVYGITYSEDEAELARQNMKYCWVFNIEDKLPDDLLSLSFDALVFSHVLEHLRNPEIVLVRFIELLKPGGQVIIAVPNVLSWRMRLQFIRGDFEYTDEGVLDRTHLKFFTHQTADKILLSCTHNLCDIKKTVTGSVPLWWLRRHILSKKISNMVDEWGCNKWPNLFGDQILLSAIKKIN